MPTLPLLDGVPADKVLDCLNAAPGNEIDSGKFLSEESSSALAVNAFGWFLNRAQLLPQLPGCPRWDRVESIALEFCARFPWSRGRHPWLDALIVTPTHIVGVESKRFEPFRDTKRANFAPAYDEPVWGDKMGPFERVRDALRTDPQLFKSLDACQLVKHAFGLVTEARRRHKVPHLHYIYAEPSNRAGKPITDQAKQLHRTEIIEFGRLVSGAEVTFSAGSYREWIGCWSAPDVKAHGKRLRKRFDP